VVGVAVIPIVPSDVRRRAPCGQRGQCRRQPSTPRSLAPRRSVTGNRS
jgi:hypothetical protein